MRKNRAKFPRPSSEQAKSRLEKGLAHVVSPKKPEVVGQGAGEEIHAAEIVSTLDVFIPKGVIIKHDVPASELKHMRDLSHPKFGAASLLKVTNLGHQQDAIISRYALGSLEDQTLLAKVGTNHSSIKPLAYYSYLFKIIQQIAGFLAEQHAANKVHRDIKPHNIFLDKDGNARIGDFGSMLDCPMGSNVAVPKFEMYHGTPYYNPLEIADVVNQTDEHAGPQVSQATDVWALGVTLGDLLGPEYSKALISKADCSKFHNKITAAYMIGQEAKRQMHAKHFNKRANNHEAALNRIIAQLDETAPLNEEQLLTLLNDLATLMTSSVGMRPSAADIASFMKPFATRVLDTSISASLSFDNDTPQPRISHIRLNPQSPKVEHLPSMAQPKPQTALATPEKKPSKAMQAKSNQRRARRQRKRAQQSHMTLFDMKGNNLATSLPSTPTQRKQPKHFPNKKVPFGGARNRYQAFCVKSVLKEARNFKVDAAQAEPTRCIYRSRN